MESLRHERSALFNLLLQRAASAEIDILGDDRFMAIDLRTILTSMSPVNAAPAPALKHAVSRRGK